VALKIMLKASVLVVSRTPELLNRLLRSLDQAYSGNADSIEVIASWNGSSEDEACLQPGRLPFRIVQHVPYHFASNMNGLARKANGAALIFANDDLIVDPGAIDAALERLETRPEVGMIGARLRTSSRQLAHAGIHFTSYGSPYHQLEHFVDADHPVNECLRPLAPSLPCAAMNFCSLNWQRHLMSAAKMCCYACKHGRSSRSRFCFAPP
jgi:hypothetical protein